MSKEKKPFDYACPYCKQKFEVPPEMIGQETKCPSCTGVFKIIDPKIRNKPPIKHTFICPNTNCNYKGQARAIARGSSIVAVILLLMLLLPGILYLMFFGGYRYRCPNCGLQIACDN